MAAAQYRAVAPIYHAGESRMIAAGDTFESDLVPGNAWAPLNAEARAAIKAAGVKTMVVWSDAQIAASVSAPTDGDRGYAAAAQAAALTGTADASNAAPGSAAAPAFPGADD
jgi:hypothetical protein